MEWNIIIPSATAVISAVLVAVLNNWDKLNKNKRVIKEIRDVVDKLSHESTKNADTFKELQSQMTKLSSAQRTSLQTIILSDCKKIQTAVDAGDTDYSESLKQLIILYREYRACGFNSQAKLYFNDTIERVSEVNNMLVRDLMNTYFSEYEP